ncbi:MAG: hypothetical protein HY436_01845 [Candidatus Liptonbacteria bacterium]|nr:hypothetical protein [Candidatus Liptonbacteria bacterium]
MADPTYPEAVSLSEEAEEAVPHVRVPSPPQVVIRTMAGDLQALREGGGVPARGGMQGRVVYPRITPVQSATSAASRRRFVRILVLFGIAGGLTVIGILVYFFVVPFIDRLREFAEEAPNAPATTAPRDAAPAPDALPRSGFVHASLFALPPDLAVTFRFTSGPARSASDLESFSQKLTLLVNREAPSARFVEVVMQDERGAALAIEEYLARIGAPILSAAFLQANAEADFSAFLVRGAAGLAHGVVLRTRGGATELRGGALQELEISPFLPDFFLAPPGRGRVEGFRDKEIAGAAARSLTYEAAGAEFIYGFPDARHLVIATSEAGFREALARIRQ